MLRMIIRILIAIASCVVGYYLVIWVLGMLGISIPAQLLTACFVLIGLVALYGAISGKWDAWWGGP